ncbi:flippase-like domain-containing protein [Flavobacterium sp. NRK F10]|uniref:lysylphosphatidylglycerol synthase transmembrane domain-containing protein n=1 Tax=Flavobacterium sp. NRK F10 TaxID=2954931 RepID=UPI00209152A8|nr:lysylphosphatidylglycerol synthase transmembrane domain-containing protein [Flavobacterium sp. NRK F10]MCO6174897.1 flippase-like domain-containing protein [Flavobacterium sp. NRK F10]
MKKFKKILSVLLPILLGAMLIVYEFNKFSDDQIEQMKHSIYGADYSFILLSGILSFLGYALRAYRWKYTLEYVGYPADFKFNLTAVSIGYFLNLTIPRSGEISRAALLTKYKDVPFDKGFGTIISERIIDFIVLLLFILTAVSIEFHTLKAFLLENIPLKPLIILGVLGFTAAFIGIYLLIFSKWKFILTIKSKISGLTEGMLSVFKMPHKWMFLFQTFLIWFTYILMFYSVVFALQETRMISFNAVIVAFVIGSLTIAFTNGGFGFFPVLIAKILFLYNIPEESGQAFGWVVWTSQLIITILLGGIAFLILSTFTKKEIN